MLDQVLGNIKFAFLITESTRDEWRTLGVVTTARAKRLVDSQFISELLFVILENQMFGFDQDALDELYAKYEVPSETVQEMNDEVFHQRFRTVKTYLLDMEGEGHAVTKYATGFGNFYTLWSLVELTENPIPPADLARKYELSWRELKRWLSNKTWERF
jgi:hypothetical protein